jgi:hypothetical protein
MTRKVEIWTTIELLLNGNKQMPQPPPFARLRTCWLMSSQSINDQSCHSNTPTQMPQGMGFQSDRSLQHQEQSLSDLLTRTSPISHHPSRKQSVRPSHALTDYNTVWNQST